VRRASARRAFFRLALALTASCCLVTLAAADNQALQRCRTITDNPARLACYDAAADSAGTENFGKESAVAKSEAVREIQAGVASVRTDARGKLVLGLDNGQTWTQIDSPSLKLKTGDQILIQRGALGSHLLSPVDGGPEIRVRRGP
jgi:hypothetical protein